MSELVSIIIPCFNAARTVSDTLDCACQQTHSNLEILVIDDGSQDASAEIVMAYPDPRVRLIRMPHRGACAARNTGLGQARGTYVQFLDANDLLGPEKIATQVEALQRAGDRTAVAYGPWWSFLNHAPFPQGANYLVGRNHQPAMELLFASMAEGFYLPTHSWLIPRVVATSAGKWDERLIQNQDGEYFSRVLAVATQVLWVPAAHAYYRQDHDFSMNRTSGPACTRSLLLAADQIRDRMIDYLGFNPERRRIIAALYLRVMYRMDCSDSEMVQQVWGRIHGLGLPDGRTKVGGMRFDLLKRMMGWELAFKMKQLARS